MRENRCRISRKILYLVKDSKETNFGGLMKGIVETYKGDGP